MKTTPEQRAAILGSILRAVPDLLDDLDIGGTNARLLVAESARVAELTAEMDRMKARRDLEETMERVALTIAERDARTIQAAANEAAATVRTVGDLTARHIGKRVRVEGSRGVAEGTLRLLPYVDFFDMWWLKVGASIHVPGLNTPCEVLS